jgi:hypothetical protein
MRFHVAVQAAIECPVGDEAVRMVCRAADYGIKVLLVKALAPIDIVLGLGESLGCVSDMVLIHVAQSYYVFSGDRAEMRIAPAPGANQGNIELVAGSIGAGKYAARQDN